MHADLVPLAGHAIEEVTLALAPFREHALQAREIGRVFRQRAEIRAHGLPQSPRQRVPVVGRGEPQERARAGVPLREQLGLAQQPQVIADTALGDAQGAGELTDGELLALQQRHHAQARGVGEELQEARDAGAGGHGRS